MMIVARHQGYFEKEGLEPLFETYPSGKRALEQGLFAGKADIASSSDLPVVERMVKNDDLVILTVLQAARSINTIVGLKDNGISSLSDLAGKKIGVQTLSALHYFLHRAIETGGIEPSEITEIPLLIEEIVPALAEGKIDAASLREPYLSMAVTALGNRAAVFETPWVYPQYEMLVTSRLYGENHPEELRRFLNALLRAEEFMGIHKPETEKILAAELNITLSQSRAILENTMNRIEMPQALVTLMETQKDWLMEIHGRQNPAAWDILEFFYLIPLAGTQPDRIDIAGLRRRGFAE